MTEDKEYVHTVIIHPGEVLPAECCKAQFWDLFYINDLELDLVNSIVKFADDTKLLGRVSNSNERDQLQQDLQQLTNWSDTLQMPFNKSKCKVMHLGCNNQQYTHQMRNQKLETVKEEKDLRVIFFRRFEAMKTMLAGIL